MNRERLLAVATKVRFEVTLFFRIYKCRKMFGIGRRMTFKEEASFNRLICGIDGPMMNREILLAVATKVRFEVT